MLHVSARPTVPPGVSVVACRGRSFGLNQRVLGQLFWLTIASTAQKARTCSWCASAAQALLLVQKICAPPSGRNAFVVEAYLQVMANGCVVDCDACEPTCTRRWNLAVRTRSVC